jgi:hypothetical protein
LPIARWRRPAGLLVSLFIPFSGALQSYAALACDAHRETSALHAHAHHNQGNLEQSQVPQHDHASGQDSCNCQSLCQSPIVIAALAAPAQRVINPADQKFEPAGRDVPGPADRDRHLLPFSTAPPSTV